MSTVEGTLGRLADIESIRQLKAKYCRAIDTKDWALLGSLFWPEATFEGFGSAPPGSTVAMFVEGVSKRLGPCVSVHHCHTPEFDFLSPDEVRVVWAMEDYVQFPPGAVVREAADSAGFRGWGHYEELYRRRDGVWRFAFLRLTRLRIDALPADHPAPKPGFLAAARDWVRNEPLFDTRGERA